MDDLSLTLSILLEVSRRFWPEWAECNLCVCMCTCVRAGCELSGLSSPRLHTVGSTRTTAAAAVESRRQRRLDM